MAMSEVEIAAFIKNKEIKLIGDRLITLTAKREKGFFRYEMDVPEEEIDELLDDEISQWIT